MVRVGHGFGVGATMAVTLVMGIMLATSLRVVGAAGAPTVASPRTTLAVPGRVNAHVSLASFGRHVAAVWAASTAEGTTDVFVAVSRDDGRTFGVPVRVNSTPGQARVNGEQPPRVTLSSRSGGAVVVTVMWTAKTTVGTALLWARSDDAGQSFAASTLVGGTDAPGNRGWEALGADPSGRVHAVWLDHRRMAAPEATRAAAGHRHGDGREGAGKADGVAMAQRSDLYVDTLDDAAPPRAIAAGVCYCCKTAIAFGPANQIYLAWRHVYPGNFRDMAFAASADGGKSFSAPLRVSEDNWMLEGCPDDGPAMRVDGRGRIHLVWPAAIDERGAQVKALFHAVSSDGSTFRPRVRIPTEGQASHPQLAVGADNVLRVAWDESGGGTRRIVTGRAVLDGSGRPTFTRSVLDDERGVYPVIVRGTAETLVAWTAGPPDASVIRLARLP